MPKFLLFTYFSLSLVIYSFGQSKQDRALNKQLAQLIAEKYSSIAPGCALLVAKNGQVIYSRGFGTANIELNVAMRPDMVFRIGSITKQYTAIAILQLVEQGKISLQDSLQKFVKDFPHKEHTITIENLLTHTSGIVDYETLDFHILNAIRIDFPPKQLIDSLAKLPLDFTPSTKYSYSNSNYLLLGYIIEQVSKKSYKDYLQENLFNPAGLSNTYYDAHTQIIKNRVSGYTRDSTNYHNVGYISMSQVFSAGALVSSVEDLFKWHHALYSYKLVKKETLEKALTPFKLADGRASQYGYGWFLRDWKGSKSIGHGGAIDGFRSMVTYFVDQDIFVAALFNSDNDNFFGLFENMADLVIGKSLTTAYKDLKLPDTILNRYVGTYVSTDLQYAKDSIMIYKEGDRLYCDLSNKTGIHMGLFAQSQTLFYIPVIKRIATTIEFIIEEGKVVDAYWTQEKKNKIRKVE
jgi:CubicO group peptidase (beta-lactamase class C family)